MIRINLLGDAFLATAGKKPDKGEPAAVYTEGESGVRSAFPLAGLLVGVLLSSLGGGYYIYLERQLTAERVRNETLEAKKKELEPYFRLEKTFREQKGILQKKEEVLLALKKRQQLPVHFVEELANCLPDDVWFTKIDQKGNKVEIKGECGNEDVVYHFRNSLAAKTQWFKDVNFPGASRKGKYLEFTITFELLNPA